MPVRNGSALNATALRSTKAGLAAVFTVSLVFATFGAWFNLLLGYGLMLAAMVAAVLGLRWADRAAHEARWNPSLTNGIYAKSGAALSTMALLLSLYYTGLLFFVLFLWPISVMGLVILYAIHRTFLDAQAAREARA